MPSKGPPLESRNVSPTCLKVRYMATRADGRLKPEQLTIEELPENVTVRYMVWLIREMLKISPRHPVELRYWGEPLEFTGETGEDRRLSYYSIKEHSELSVVVKPALSPTMARNHPMCEPNATRLRVASHKLGAAIPIEGLVPEMRVRDIKATIIEWLKKNPIFLVRGPPRPGIMCTKPDGTTEEVRPGEHFVRDSGGGGGGKGKGAPANLRRVSDGLVGALQEADFWEMKLDEQEQKPSIHFNGFPLPDDSYVASHGLVNHEILYLNFWLPWEENDPKPVEKAGGGKKKK